MITGKYNKTVWYALTALASATLLNLNGLKSSLTCTGVFLSPTFPKKGLGTGGEVEDYRKYLHEISGLHAPHILSLHTTSGLFLGDEFAEAPTAVLGEA